MSKEILCPVCGEEMFTDNDFDYCCANPDCHLMGKYRKGVVNQFNHQIQSRIDRAVEEAVRKERENSIVMYGIYEGSSHDGGGCHAELYRTIEEVQSAIDLYVAKQAINETFVWQKFEGEHDIGGWHYGRIDVGDTSFEYETIAIQEFRIT